MGVDPSLNVLRCYCNLDPNGPEFAVICRRNFLGNLATGSSHEPVMLDGALAW
jgi:hypothetical protein